MKGVRELFEAGTTTGATDGELLERFASRRDEGAFAALVERHGPMVLRVCRAELGDHHDALDAFQAVFLVLARKGDSLWVGDSLGPWLHRVARRAAGRARRAGLRRSAAERRAAESARTAIEPPFAPDRDETAAVIHAEVDRLPEPFRAAVVLCDLEGLTCDEAAMRLGSPPGTVASRLSRGRGKLRDRLRRWGLDPASPLAIAPAALPAGLADATASAAARFVALSSSAAPTGAAVVLALGVLRAMSWRSWWKSAATALALAASTSGVVALAARGGGPAQEPTAKAEPPKVETVTVGPASFQVRIAASGTLKATNREPVISPLPIPAVIESILPHGTRVKKGDVIVVFNRSALEQSSVERRAKYSEAEMELRAAREARDISVLALKEYESGVYLSQKAAAEGEVKTNQSALNQSVKRAERLKELREKSKQRMQKRGDAPTSAELLADQEIEDRETAAQLAVIRDQFTLQQVKDKVFVLDKFTMPRETKALRGELNTAEAKVAAAERKLEKAQAEEMELRQGIEDGVARSPVDGVVTEPADQQPGVPISPGASVHPRQILVHVQAPDGHLVVNAKVPAREIAKIRKGQSAVLTVVTEKRRSSIRIAELDGVVEAVSPIPDPSSNFRSEETVYTVEIGLKPPAPGTSQPRLRAGQSVDVKIKVEPLKGVPAVPSKALVWYDGAHHVGVRRDDGSIEWREVEIGLTSNFISDVRPGPNGSIELREVEAGATDEVSTEILSGLKLGEAVVADADAILSDDQRRRISIAPPPPPPTLRKREVE